MNDFNAETAVPATLVVMVIDDDDVDREQISRILKGTCEVVEARLASEGIRLVKERSVDCVLVDYHLPDEDGMDVISRVRKLGLPVIMMTGQGDEQSAVEAMKRGAKDYISKRDLKPLELKRAIESAVQIFMLEKAVSEKNEEIKLFVDHASHDLKAPLRRLRQLGGMLSTRMINQNGAESEELIDLIRDEARRASDLVESLYTYCRVGRKQHRMKEVDLNSVMRDVTSTYDEAIKASRARIQYSDLPGIQADVAGMRVLFGNLLANSLKYSSPDDPFIEIEVEEEERWWVFSVLDNGVGVPEESLERIFQPFFRLHSNSDAEGSGLGLSICRKVAEQHHGLIWAENRGTKGLRIRVRLPKML